MAKVGNNIVTTGLSGKLGNLIVFRNRGGKTIVSKTPRSRTIVSRGIITTELIFGDMTINQSNCGAIKLSMRRLIIFITILCDKIITSVLTLAV